MLATTFDFELVEKEEIFEVILKGNLLSSYDAQVFTKSLAALDPAKNKFIINLEHLKYMNSEGFNILLKILTKSRNSGGDAVVINLSTELEQLFIITKLHNIFTTAKTKDEAIGLLKG